MKRKLTAWALVLMLLAGAVSAAAFPDIDDPRVEEAAQVLRLLGVVNGTPDGGYHPQGMFTRAEFCKMALVALDRQEEAQTQGGRVIFTDVTAAHWALGYVNAAAAVGEGKTPLVQGRGSGRFEPDAPITSGEAAAILVRALGYADADTPSVGAWYAGAMKRAASVGLLKGLEGLTGGETITRGQAALLFENLLFAKPKGSGDIFLASVLGGSVTEPELILGQGSRKLSAGGWSLVTDSKTYRTFRSGWTGDFTGGRAALVLDRAGDVLALRDDPDSSTQTVTVENAEARYLEREEGERVSVPPKTPVYRDGELLGTYEEEYPTRAFAPGVSAVLCFDKTDTLTSICLKSKSASGELLRLTGVYEEASPSPASPGTVTVMGNPFKVKEEALDSLTAFRPGDRVTLVLDSDMEVVKGEEPEKDAPGALGVADIKKKENGEEKGRTTYTAKVELACGITVEGNTEATIYAADHGLERIAAVTSNKLGELTITYPVSDPVPGDWNVKKGTVGVLSVSSRLAVYDKAPGGPLTQVEVKDVTVDTVPGSSIAFLHTDREGKADLLVLDNVSGDCYRYGVVKESKEKEGDNVITVLAAAEEDFSFLGGNGWAEKKGTFWGVAPALSRIGSTPRPGDSVKLAALTGVHRTAFDKESVTVNGVTYPLASTLFCYNTTSKKAFKSLEEALAYSAYLTLYYDRDPAQGGKIRVVTAG